MWNWSFLPHNLILDVFVVAVLLMILGLTLLVFIQALVDSIFVLGRKPALKCLGLGMRLDTLARACFLDLRSCLLPHLSQRIDAGRVLGRHSHPLGLPHTRHHIDGKQVYELSLSDSKTFCILAIFLGLAASGYILTMHVPLPDPGDFRFEGGPLPIVIEGSGRVRDVYVTEGSRVRAGDVVVQLDTIDLRQRKSLLESQIHSAELHQADARTDLPTLYAELRQLEMDMDRLTVTSPSDGEIGSLEALHIGERLLAGTAIGVVFPCGAEQ
jgi:Biotin-lipoyl like